MNPHVDCNIIETTSTGTIVTSLKAKTTNDFEKVVRAIGEDTYREMETLDLGDQTGSTGYIDFVRPEDMDQAVMKGEDKYGRKFVAFLLEVDGVLQVETLFQRYTDEFSSWTSGGRGLPILCHSRLTDEDCDVIRRLVDNALKSHGSGRPVGRRNWRGVYGDSSVDLPQDVFNVQFHKETWSDGSIHCHLTYEEGTVRIAC